MKKTTKKTPITAEELVTVIRTCNADMTSKHGFKYPESGPVECPDWNDTPQCGNGLHGCTEISDDWGLFDWDISAKALIIKVPASLVVKLGGKVKFKSGIVEKVTTLAAAICEVLIQPARIKTMISAIFGEAGFKSGGTLDATNDDSKLAASGDDSKLAASGYASKLAASGDASKLAASGNASQLAASGDDSIAVGVGPNSAVMAGPGGTIALTWRDGKRYRLVVGYIGENGIEPGVWYRLNDDHCLEAVGKE